jgi:hypothetical protein
MNPTTNKEGQAAKNRIAEFRQNVNNGATPTEARRTVRNIESGTSRVETPTAMGADTLNSSESLIQVPNVPPTGASDAMGSYLESFQQNQTDEFTKAQEARTKEAEGKTSTAFEDYIKGLAGEQSVEGLTMKAEDKFGTPELEQEVNRLNADLMSEQRALKKRLDVLNANAQGGLASGVAGEIANAQRESYSKQADIAVVQMAAQGRFDSAKAMADRQAAIQFADQTRDLGIREKIYTENKELFTKEEQRLFETKQGDRNRKLDAEKEAFTKLQDVKLDALKMAQMNGAPVSVLQAIQGAKTPVEVLEVGGKYGSTDLLDRELKRAQLDEIRSQTNARNTSSTTIKAPTQAELTARGYGERLLDATITIEEVGSKFTDTLDRISSSQFFPQGFKSGDQQKFEQAQRNFINAVLRRESGAAISDSEFANASLQYFPQPGDKEANLIQKKRNRDMVTKSILREGGLDTYVQDKSLADPLGLGINTASSNPLEL